MKSSNEAASGRAAGPSKHQGGRVLGRHVVEAHATVKGEHQLPEYVARLWLDQCVEILAASPMGLPALASRHGECRVEAGEERGFEDVIRTWTVYVLSGVEAG